MGLIRTISVFLLLVFPSCIKNNLLFTSATPKQEEKRKDLVLQMAQFVATNPNLAQKLMIHPQPLTSPSGGLPPPFRASLIEEIRSERLRRLLTAPTSESLEEVLSEVQSQIAMEQENPRQLLLLLDVRDWLTRVYPQENEAAKDLFLEVAERFQSSANKDDVHLGQASLQFYLSLEKDPVKQREVKARFPPRR